MDVEIGQAAGEVYSYLESNGSATVSQIKKGTGRTDAEVHRGLGWLARESKVTRETRGRSTVWGLLRE